MARSSGRLRPRPRTAMGPMAITSMDMLTISRRTITNNRIIITTTAISHSNNSNSSSLCLQPMVARQVVS